MEEIIMKPHSEIIKYDMPLMVVHLYDGSTIPVRALTKVAAMKDAERISGQRALFVED